jgi:general secretion pathway protein D
MPGRMNMNMPIQQRPMEPGRIGDAGRRRDAAGVRRRIVLSMSKWLPAWVALSLCLSAPGIAVAASLHALQGLASANVVSQLGKSKGTTSRGEAESLMVRARKAMKEGRLDEADSLISQAEKLKVEYSVLHFGDTPKKLRAELRAAERTAKKQNLKRPSERFPDAADKPAEPKPPRVNDASEPSVEPGQDAVTDPTEEKPLAMPKTDGKLQPLLSSRAPISPSEDAPASTELPEPSGREDAKTETAPGDAAKALGPGMAHLIGARRALAVGDVRRAATELEAARQTKATYGPHDDSPDKVDAAIRRYRQVMEALNGQGDSEAGRHQLADALMEQAVELARWQDYDEAERLANSVKGLRVNYGPFEARPDALLQRIGSARRRAGGTNTTAADAEKTASATAGEPTANQNGAPAVFQQGRDHTRNRQAAAQDRDAASATASDGGTGEAIAGDESLPSPRESAPNGSSSAAAQLVVQAEDALRERDTPKALEFFRQAYKLRDQLDPQTAQRVQDHLQLLSAPAPAARAESSGESLIDGATAKQQLLAKQLSAEVAQKQMAAQKMREKDPKRSLETLKEARALVEGGAVDPAIRAQLLRRVDRSVGELDKYIEEHRAQIEMDETHREVLKDVDRRRQQKVEVDDKLAKLVDEFNRLMDEQRFAEAEVLAKRARELDPENPIVKQLIWQNRFLSRTQRNTDTREEKEKQSWNALQSVEESMIPFDDREPYRMPDAKKWDDLTKTRAKRLAENRSRRSPAELEVERRLKTPVSCKFRNRPLSEVLEHLAKLAAVNLYLDPKGLGEEGVTSDSPVTIDLTQDISLKSALNLILEPLHLSYVVQNEVLKITSEQLRDGVLRTETYNVADLVIPIPNFVPNGRVGLAGALSDAYNMSGGGMGMGSPGTAYLASRDGTDATGVVGQNVMAQMNQMGQMGSRQASGTPQSIPFGPGGVGGGAQPDFDTLVDLITTTIKPQTWDEVGGPGSIQRFPNNLSLVISQTQEVHEEIVDLLEQLRRNQDLQVTIEVRFITLNDNFFERIGVDFQFDLLTHAPRAPLTQDPTTGVAGVTPGNLQEIVGINTSNGNSPGVGALASFNNNLSIPFRQDSFNLATPQFGTPVEVAHFGFAILSDLEAYFLVNAAQGDRRSNVLQAPKVTMFNGQQASVVDFTQQPFVISVIPVVGDFAAAYQPVITVLSEGTALTVQAVISNDRRFVRLTVVPFFSTIGDVTTFTFSGTSTTTKNTSASKSAGGSGGDSSADSNNSTTTNEGITLQQPSFTQVSVNTTVSVPDGGTVLLGGIKRLSEGRNEFGVPILSKLPYINRLFKNVGIGRETQSLMMMVTPRIIIQEEEEERLGMQSPP